MLSTPLLEERSDKEPASLWIEINIQVCMFVRLCWNTILSFSKTIVTSICTVITETNENKKFWNAPYCSNSTINIDFWLFKSGHIYFGTGVSRLIYNR